MSKKSAVNTIAVLCSGGDSPGMNSAIRAVVRTAVANGLTVGNTYYVRVYSWTDAPLQDVTFDICVFTIPPPIYTSTTDYTVEELVEDVLIDSECSLVSNITWSTGSNFGSTNGIGYFEANGSSWLVLSRAKFIPASKKRFTN